jgi:tRNA-2-methylthio-N6-dimethylallyladenosine synthase
VDVSFPEIEKFDHLPPPRVEGPSAFVSIMEGCSKYCSFCVVPYTRGEEVSRAFDDVLTEVADLADQGVKEVTLLGQNVNAYRAPTAADGEAAGEVADLATLIEYLAEIPGLERIRYTTSHPKEMSQRLIEAYRAVLKLVSQLHLPVQSGSDRVLAAMKRAVHRARVQVDRPPPACRSPAAIASSDFIVGFPARLTGTSSRRWNSSPTSASTAASASSTARDRERPRRVRGSGPAHDLQPARAAAGARRCAISRTQQEWSARPSVLVTGPAGRRDGELAARTENNRVVNFRGRRRSAATSSFGSKPRVRIRCAVNS